jgi:hypothetical protein
VTKIPVDNEISSEGIWLTRPSPIVRMVYLSAAAPMSMPCLTTPIIIPPIIFTNVIIKPAVASPLTYFTAPSIEPKKLASCWSFSL